MIEDIKDGWQGVPINPDHKWLCPECNCASNIADWKECEPYCEDCGSHDGRRCPNCREVYDHVWGSVRLAKAQSKEPQL